MFFPLVQDADAPDDVGTSSRADKKKKKKDKSKKKKGKSAVDDVTEATLGQDVVGELKQLAESGSVESKKRKVDELMDEYDKLDYEDMVRLLLSSRQAPLEVRVVLTTACILPCALTDRKTPHSIPLR